MQGCRPLTAAEVAQVTKAFTGPFALRNRAFFLMGVQTGYRISELLSLRVGDVYRQGQIVTHISVRRYQACVAAI
jgi:integrase